MSDADNQATTWIGLVEVQPLPGSDALDGLRGAIVNVLALCADREQFVEMATRCLKEYGLRAVRHSDVGPLSTWILTNELHMELRELEERLSIENPVQFDEFQGYSDDP